ncbi:hypothetical protein D9M68_900680 [compost metagenome]
MSAYSMRLARSRSGASERSRMAVFGFVFSAWYQTTTLRTREWAVSSIARSKAAEYCANVSRENGPAIHARSHWERSP